MLQKKADALEKQSKFSARELEGVKASPKAARTATFGTGACGLAASRATGGDPEATEKEQRDRAIAPSHQRRAEKAFGRDRCQTRLLRRPPRFQSLTLPLPRPATAMTPGPATPSHPGRRHLDKLSRRRKKRHAEEWVAMVKKLVGESEKDPDDGVSERGLAAAMHLRPPSITAGER